MVDVGITDFWYNPDDVERGRETKRNEQDRNRVRLDQCIAFGKTSVPRAMTGLYVQVLQ